MVASAIGTVHKSQEERLRKIKVNEKKKKNGDHADHNV